MRRRHRSSVLDILSVRCPWTPPHVGTARELRAENLSLGNISTEGIYTFEIGGHHQRAHYSQRSQRKWGSDFPRPRPPNLSFTILLLHDPTKGEGLSSLGQAQVLPREGTVQFLQPLSQQSISNVSPPCIKQSTVSLTWQPLPQPQAPTCFPFR